MKKYFQLSILSLFFLATSSFGHSFDVKSSFSLRPPGTQEDILGWNLPSTAARWPFSKGSLWINAGTSIGVIGYNILGSRKGFFPFQASADYSISPHFSVGPYMGFYRVTYSDNYSGINYDSKLTSYIFGGRVLMHTTDIINKETGADINLQHWDIYAGLSAGIVYWNWSLDKNYFGNNSVYDRNFYTSAGLVIGAKYMINSSFAVHAETGKGMFGFVSFGLSGKIH